MLVLVTGTPGAGKSYYAVRTALGALEAGKFVATNVQLTDDWAERYAAAATLYEMATGSLPKWGDGNSDPSHLNCEATIDAEVFDANWRIPQRTTAAAR